MPWKEAFPKQGARGSVPLRYGRRKLFATGVASTASQQGGDTPPLQRRCIFAIDLPRKPLGGLAGSFCRLGTSHESYGCRGHLHRIGTSVARTWGGFSLYGC